MYGCWQHTHIDGKYRTALPSPTMIRNRLWLKSSLIWLPSMWTRHSNNSTFGSGDFQIHHVHRHIQLRQILKLFTPSFPSIPIHNASESREPVSIRLCFSSLALFAAFSGLKLLRFFSPFQLPSYFCMVLYFFLSFTFSIPCSCPQRLRFKQFKK